MRRFLYLLFIVLFIQSHNIRGQGSRKYDSFTFSNKTYNYSYFLPSGYDQTKTYPALIGPGEGTAGSDKSFFWDVSDPGKFGWILVEFSLWRQNSNIVEALLKKLNEKFNIEGDKFHVVGFSANSESVFSHAISNPQYFHSLTGIPGSPSSRNSDQLRSLKNVKIQNIVGEKDQNWLKSARELDTLYKDLGLTSKLEIIPGGEHVLKQLVGEGLMKRMEMMRK